MSSGDSDLKGFLDPLVFDDGARIEIPVSIGDKKYVLVEANGTALAVFNELVLKAAKYDDATGKFRPGEGIADVNFTLLASCLLDAETRVPVTPQFVRDLPNRVSKPLIERLKKVSGMDDGKDEKKVPAGKSADPSTSGSS